MVAEMIKDPSLIEEGLTKDDIEREAQEMFESMYGDKNKLKN